MTQRINSLLTAAVFISVSVLSFSVMAAAIGQTL
jgi:hypothetical protein